jgi:hypothetical protein
VLPWQAKIAAKLLLAQLPVTYDTWRRLGIFRHGAMDRASYAVGVWERHVARVDALPEGFVALEIGPGDSLLSAICASASGASAVWLVDQGPFATTDLAPYRDAVDVLGEAGLAPPDLTGCRDVSDVLDRCSATYLTGGLAAWAHIPDGSVHLSWSQAALEHVRVDEVPPLLAELWRVHAPGSASSHRIDLQDHLALSLNNLRVPTALWETTLFRTSGFYTNRLRRADWLAAFTDAGFVARDDGGERWPYPPVDPAAMVEPYRSMDPDDLAVAAVDVVAHRPR